MIPKSSPRCTKKGDWQGSDRRPGGDLRNESFKWRKEVLQGQEEETERGQEPLAVDALIVEAIATGRTATRTERSCEGAAP